MANRFLARARAWLVPFTLLLAGCGGRVVVDGPGGGGSAGGGGGVGPTDPDAVCSAWCDAEKQAGCPMEIGAGDCETGCLTTFGAVPSCAPSLAAFLDCTAADLAQTGNCMTTSATCNGLADAFAQCINTGPMP